MRTPTSWGIAFEPLRHQDDGSIWINAASLKNGSVPPTCVNIYSANMLDFASIQFGDVRTMEPACAKILLGMHYLVLGRNLVYRSGFDPLRRSLAGTMDPAVQSEWITPEELKHRLSPELSLVPDRHSIFGECRDGVFVGRVALFGLHIVEMRLPDCRFDLGPGVVTC